VRESEVKELELLMANVPCDVRVSKVLNDCEASLRVSELREGQIQIKAKSAFSFKATFLGFQSKISPWFPMQHM
jgi:hypothetical protein